MKNSIEQLNQEEINTILGAGIKEAASTVASVSLEIIKGAFLPVLGGIAGFMIIKILSKPHAG